MRAISDLEFTRSVESFKANRTLDARYASFDFCFNYFQQARAKNELDHLLDVDRQETTCLQLAFYLASWGMLRGKADLLQHSAHKLLGVVEFLIGQDKEVWEIDANTLKDDYQVIRDLSRGIRRSFGTGVSVTDTLSTKIILGVMGSVPAFDRYFRKGFGCSTFGPKSLRGIGSFYEEHAEAIDSIDIPTLDFTTGEETDIRYTRSKLIDMAFFTLGVEA